jgi:hypothetical protein
MNMRASYGYLANPPTQSVVVLYVWKLAVAGHAQVYITTRGALAAQPLIGQQQPLSPELLLCGCFRLQMFRSPGNLSPARGAAAFPAARMHPVDSLLQKVCQQGAVGIFHQHFFLAHVFYRYLYHALTTYRLRIRFTNTA